MAVFRYDGVNIENMIQPGGPFSVTADKYKKGADQMAQYYSL